MGTVTHNFSCNFRCCSRRYKIVNMNPMVCLFALFATALAAPVPEAESWNGALPAAGYGYAGLGHAGLGYAGLAAPALAGAAVAAPAVAAVVPAAPVPTTLGAAPAPYVAHAPAISLPAPYTTSHVAGPDAVSVHVPEPIVTKKIEYGTRPYIAAYDTTVLKPVLGDIDIAVPTALLGTVSHNAPITRVSKEPFVVNEPVPVEKPYNVPYEVLKHVTNTVKVPTPVHVDAPYNVPVPTPVQGEPIIQKVTGPARVIHTHENRVAPAVHTGAVYGGTYGHGIAAARVAAVGAVGAIADPAWA